MKLWESWQRGLGKIPGEYLIEKYGYVRDAGDPKRYVEL